jgi:surfeit locus 1 family protein
MAVLVAGGFAFAGLGIWQVERRSEKLALIASVDQRMRAGIQAAPGPAQWPSVSFTTDAYRRVRVHGVFQNDREVLVQAVTGLGPGYWLMTPLRTDDGWTVLVNRGFVSPENRPRAARSEGEPRGSVAVSGLLRTTEPGGGFLRSNDPAHDRWYSRDVAEIAKARHLGRIAPYFIDASASPDQARQPVGGLTVVSFANNHLQYALTWFALAILCLVGLLRLRRARR